ncbi:MAG: DUF1109 domain-containing protein [Rhodospirillaceae bacterium]|nr:MAG: DUF1109 domain-containing protein [Rhodospirillaceae bacterium]
MKTEDLIDRLAWDLRPVKRLPSPAVRTLFWIVPLVVGSAFLLLGLGRPDALQTLGIKLQRLEILVALATSIVAAFAAFSSGNPGRSLWVAYLPVPLLVIWACILMFSLWNNADGGRLDMTQFRPAWSCIFLFVSFALFPMITLTLMLRRAAPILRDRAVVLGGIASASLAVLMLRLDLFHAPNQMPEMFTEHLGGLLMLAGLTAAMSKWLLPDRLSCPGEY